MSLLPEIFRVTAGSTGPLAALVAAGSDMHAPIRSVLDRMDELVDPFRCPDALVPFLAWWVDLGWLTLPDSDSTPKPSLRGGNSRLRDLIASSADLSARRGTTAGVIRFLQLATGVPGFTVENVPGAFHFRVHVPDAGADQLDMISRIVRQLKPAHVTAEIVLESTGLAATGPSAAVTESATR
jgi:phage tail-like protein